MKSHTTVTIIGSSIAGCTAALLFANSGIRVTVIDKITNINHYKIACTHFIQPCALATLQRLGLDKLIEEAGGLRNKADIWTQSGWIRSEGPYSRDRSKTHGYNIEREVLDPLLRKLIIDHPFIHYEINRKLVKVNFENGLDLIKSIECVDKLGLKYIYSSKLIIAADGRFSTTAQLAGNKEELFPNNRFACFAYFKSLPLLAKTHSQFWMLNPNMAFAYPLSNNKSLICLFIHKNELKEWIININEKFYDMVRNLELAPCIDEGERISPIYRIMNMTNRMRNPVKSGIAYIGDAAMALDPMSGVGCGFAFQSAQWLADSTIPALQDAQLSLNEALQKYHFIHQRNLLPCATGINAESLGEKESTYKTAFYYELVNNPMLTEAFLSLTGRLISPRDFQLIYIKSKLTKKYRADT